jgi:hypothetical protein
MSMLGKALCRLGRHSGQWSHAGSRCETVRTCDVCGKTEELTRHAWGRYTYVDADQCGQIRRCERCGSTESRSWHQWGPWLYLNTEFTSPQVRTCRRCHESERTSYTMR